MIINSIKVALVEIGQKPPIKPYRSHIRTSDTTISGIVRLEANNGIVGWGEFNTNFLPDLSASAMYESALPFVDGRDASNIQLYHQECTLEKRLFSGIELAMWDMWGKQTGLPVATLLGGALKDRVELAACMGIKSYEEAGQICSQYVDMGFTTVKTKAGSDIQEDLDMVRGIRDAVGDKLQIRIDPNRAYSPEEAAQLATALEPYELQYLEQPIMAEPLSDAHWLKQQTTTPIALNESVVEPDSVVEILKANAADFLLPDTHIAGGILPCVQIGHLCEAANIPCIMHCGHDLGPKTAAMIHVAASGASYTLGNDTTYYGLLDDILETPFQIESGHLAVSDKPGLGIEVSDEKVLRYAIDSAGW